MAVGFSIEDEPAGAGAHVVSVQGEVDLFTVPELKSRLAAPIDAGTRRVVVDLTEVSFIDSSSLGVLIEANKRLIADGGALVVVVTDKAIASTFRITGLDRVFEMVRDREAALAGG